MAIRNTPVPLGRSGRIRGHGVAPTSRRGRYVVDALHHPSKKGEKPTPQKAVQAAEARLRRESLQVKPPSMGAEGRVPLASPSTRRANLRNARRKSTARGRNRGRRALHG